MLEVNLHGPLAEGDWGQAWRDSQDFLASGVDDVNAKLEQVLSSILSTIDEIKQRIIFLETVMRKSSN